MKQRSTTRMVNGILSAVILCLFLIHAVLGTFAGFASLPVGPTALLRAGMALVGVHVVVCLVTSYEQLTDTVRPPSAAKKRHLALKWATGVVLACAAAFHIARVNGMDLAGAIHSPIGTEVTIALIAALAVHSWAGSKSLLKDLNIDRKYRTALRAAVSAIAVALGCALLLSMAN